MRSPASFDGHARLRLAPAVLTVALAASGVAKSAAAALPTAPMARYVGTRGADDGNDCLVSSRPCGTIAHALLRAFPGDQIVLRAGTYAEHGLVVPRGLTISGAGQGATIIDAQGMDRAFTIAGAIRAAGPTTMEDLTITNGDAPGSADGGAILVTGGALELTRVEITDSWASNGGAVSCASGCTRLTIKHSTMTNNRATNLGGAVSTVAETLVDDSALSSNTAADEDDGHGGAISCHDATLMVRNSELANNVANSWGGAIEVERCATRIEGSTLAANWSNESAGAVWASDCGELDVMNSTLSGNTGADPSAILAFCSTYIGNTTIVDNQAKFYDQLGGPDVQASPLLMMTNSIVAHPTRGAWPYYLVSAPLYAGVRNLIDVDSGFPGGFRVGAIDAATLGALGDNGGRTRTHALLPGNNAIDAVADGCFDPSTGNALAYDQRPSPRPVGAGALCDIGAFERR